MTSFTNGVELIDPRCLLGKHEKAAPAIGCRPFAFLHIGTICLEVRIRSAALIFLARHKTAILGMALPLGCGGRSGQATSLSTPDRGRGVAMPHLRRWYGSLILLWEKSQRTRRPAPRQSWGRRYSVIERINSSHIPRTKNIQMRGYITKLFSNIFSCSPIRF